VCSTLFGCLRIWTIAPRARIAAIRDRMKFGHRPDFADLPASAAMWTHLGGSRRPVNSLRALISRKGPNPIGYVIDSDRAFRVALVGCSSTSPGHLTDHTQGRRALRQRNEGKHCQVKAAMPDGNLRLEIDGAEVRAWHHQPTSIYELLNAVGHEAVLVEDASVLLVRPNSPNAGWHGFNVALGGTTTACLEPET
jgi:hypothetical protein